MMSKIKHVTGNAYFIALRPYYFHSAPFRKYFLSWNRGEIKGSNIDERKIFNASDLYYIKKLSLEKTREIIATPYFNTITNIAKSNSTYNGANLNF